MQIFEQLALDNLAAVVCRSANICPHLIWHEIESHAAKAAAVFARVFFYLVAPCTFRTEKLPPFVKVRVGCRRTLPAFFRLRAVWAYLERFVCILRKSA